MLCRRSFSRIVASRAFAGNNVPGEVRGYRPLHDIHKADLTTEELEAELWNRLANADRFVTQCPLYGGMWLIPILEEVRANLDEIETLAVRRHPTMIDQVMETSKCIRRKARQVEYDFELDAVEE